MNQRVFEINKSGIAKELSREEKEKRALERQKRALKKEMIEFANKHDWVQKILKINNVTLDKWVDQQVSKKLEEEKVLRK